MARSIARLLPDIIPPKEETPGVDFIAILDTFDPSKLDEKTLSIISTMDRFITGEINENDTYEFDGVVYPVPPSPIDERIQHGRHLLGNERRHLTEIVEKWKSGGSYARCRKLLALALTTKACMYIVESKEQKMTAADKEAEIAAWNDYNDIRKGKRLSKAEIEAQEKFRTQLIQNSAIQDYLRSNDLARQAVYKAVMKDKQSIWMMLEERCYAD